MVLKDTELWQMVFTANKPHILFYLQKYSMVGFCRHSKIAMPSLGIHVYNHAFIIAIYHIQAYLLDALKKWISQQPITKIIIKLTSLHIITLLILNYIYYMMN